MIRRALCVHKCFCASGKLIEEPCAVKLGIHDQDCRCPMSRRSSTVGRGLMRPPTKDNFFYRSDIVVITID